MCFVKSKYEKKNSYLFIINISLAFTEASSIIHIYTHIYIYDKIFKNGPSKICGRQPLKIFKSV